MASAPERDPRGCPISVVIATRDDDGSITGVLDALVPQVAAAGGEVIVACASGRAAAVEPPVTWLPLADANILNLRRAAMARARGEIVAVGEDHAVPTPGWCEAVLRAHAERPEAEVVVGCLANGTDRTVAGRANFLGFAAPFTVPMPRLPDRPPPISTVSFKRRILGGVEGNPGCIESELLPRLFAEGQMVADDRIVSLHYQDHGPWWALTNAFTNTRANYGYSASALDPRARRRVARWVAAHLAARQWGEAWAARRQANGPADLALIVAINAATAAGALLGTFAGPGRAADRVA